MTPQEKAKELVARYDVLQALVENFNYHHAKECALITVDEIINCDRFFKTLEDTKEFTDYWCKVQQEIEKL